MGTQHGAPHKRIFACLEYRLYKEYNNIWGKIEQDIDKKLLKTDGWLVKSGNVTKGGYTRERALYIRRR
jgi:hypothetical protein